MIKEGIYTNDQLSDDDYHDDREYISSSGLKMLLDSPEAFYAQYIANVQRKESQVFHFGKAAHATVLEPDKFESLYVISPEFNRRTNQGKEDEKEFIKECEKDDVKILTQDEWDLSMHLRDSVLTHPIAGPALSGSISEQSYFIRSPEINEKVRLDAFKEDKRIIIDLKFMDDISRFNKDCVDYGYPLSEAMYKNVVSRVIGENVNYVFIVAQKKPPYPIYVGYLDEAAQQYGQDKYQQARESYIEKKLSNKWVNIEPITLPYWANPKPKEY